MRLAGMLILGLFIALAAAAYFSGRQVQRSSELITTDAVPGMIAAHKMRMDMSRSVGWAMVAASAQTTQSRDASLKTVHDADRAFTYDAAQYLTTVKINPVADRALFNELTNRFAEFQRQRMTYEALFLGGNRDGSAAFLETNLVPAYMAALQPAEALLKYNNGNSITYSGYIRNSIHRLYWAVAVVMVLALACAAVLVMNFAIRRREIEELKMLKVSIDKHFDAAYWMDASNQFVYVNDTACKVLGYAREELLGKPLTMIAPNITPQILGQVWKDLRETGFFSRENMHRRKDGSEFPVEIVATYVCFGGKEFNCGFARDITERIRVEQALARSVAELRTIFERGAIGMALVSPEGRPIRCNPALERFLGYGNDELCRMTFVEFTHPDDATHDMNLYQQLMRGENESYQIDKRYVQKNGAVVWGCLTVSVVRAPDGKPAYCVGMVEDITERKRAEESLRRLNRELRAISDCNQILVRAEDEDNLLQNICHIICEKAGYRMAWVGYAENDGNQAVRPVAWTGTEAGYLATANITWADTERGRGPVGTAIRTGATTCIADFASDSCVAPWREAALQRGFRSSIALPLKDETGHSFGVLAIYSAETNAFTLDETRLLEELAGDLAFGITTLRHRAERKRAQEELISKTALLEAQVDSTIDGILVVDNEGRRILQNQRFYDLFKIPEEITRDADHSKLLPYAVSQIKNNPEQFEERVAYLYAHPDEVSREEIELIDGKILERYASPVRDKAGKHYGRIWTFRDITEQAKLQEQLRQSQKMEAVGQLASGVAHDFNNILAVILMQAELLRTEGNLSPAQKGFALEIGETAQRAAALTRQLLLFSRKEKMQLRELDLDKSINDMTRMLRRTIGQNVELQFKFSIHPLFVRADAGMMDQVLMNLAVNARDAMPNGGKLVIETSSVELDELSVATTPKSRPGSFVCLSVSDTGCGIPPEILPKIFEPFFTTKDVGKGTGLGLATVFGIVQQHQGWINVYSEVGRGTIFRIFLPRLARISDQKSAPPATGPMPGGNEMILFVEDEPKLRASVTSLLSRLGYNVLEAANGAGALAVWNEHRAEIHLLLTDMIMPGGMTGKDLGEQLLKENPGLKVIYVSGYSGEVAGNNLQLQEGVNFLTKPFQAQKLATAIRNSLDRN